MQFVSPELQKICFNTPHVFQDIFENANIGIFQTTPEGRYIRVNPALAEMYGYTDVEEMLSALTDIEHQLYVEEGRREAFQTALLEHGEVENFESQVRRKDGSAIWISETARVIRCVTDCPHAQDDCASCFDGRAVYYEGFVKNITERKALEGQVQTFTTDLENRVKRRTHELTLEVERRRLAQASLQQALGEAEHAAQAKSKFLANMSHELRTPLNAIIGFAQAIQAEIHGQMQPASYGEYIGIIDNSARHLLALINDILDLSKIDSGKVELDLEVIDLARVVAESVDLIQHRAEQAGVTISCNLVDGVGTMVQLDARRIKQVLLNVLSNAVKFTPSGGAVRIELSETAEETLLLSISDSGVGIAEDDIPKVLSEYGQAEHGLDHVVEGTGLGLPISKKLVELHGGTFALDSEIGEGTTVKVCLPRVSPD